MEHTMASDLEGVPLPDFGVGIAFRSEPCTPLELFQGLFLELEDHVHFMPVAFQLALGALEQAELPMITEADSEAFARALVASANVPLEPFEGTADDAIRVVRELAPLGLADGAWLRGAMLANAVESETGMRLLRQLMTRFGGPGVEEAYSTRYASLLRSVGIQPEAITRPLRPACSELAYEHALLGISLGLFPTTLGPETAGFNLWMAALGPCPLLERVAPALREAGACVRYLELHDREAMSRLAAQAVVCWLGEAPDDAARAVLQRRIARGFAAAQASYERWAHVASATQRAGALLLSGRYTAPQDPQGVEIYAYGTYLGMSESDLYFRFANVDLYPASRIVAREYAYAVFDRIEDIFKSDARLNSGTVPAYSERTAAEIVAEQHDKNARTRGQLTTSLLSSNSEEAHKGLQEVFDGCWLQGFADVYRAGFEEYGWLFRIYASEHGDGDFAWNHCQIFRRAFDELGPNVMLPKTDRRLYELFEVGAAAMITMAVSLNTRRFMPELLGINLAIESTGVAGSYMDQWKVAEIQQAPFRALAWRLHNSIDNYADGHTKWSLSAVCSFMRRVRENVPESVELQWGRVWRLWRARDILVHGSQEEQAALEEHFEAGLLAAS